MPFFTYGIPPLSTYGNLLNYLYGFWLESFLVYFFALKLFSLISKIKIPWWLYLVLGLLITHFLTQSIGGNILIIIVYTLCIYLLVVQRQINYNTIINYFVISYMYYLLSMSVIGQVVLQVVNHTIPEQSLLISNYGGPIILTVEFFTTYWLLKKIRPLLRDYVKDVIPYHPISTWIINLALLSFILVRSYYAYQRLSLNPFVYALIAIAYGTIYYLTIRHVTKYTHYQQLTINQQTELVNLQNYSSHIEEMYDDLRRFRHDYKNILLSLSDAIKTGSMKDVQQIFNRVILPTNNQIEPRTAVLGHLENIEDLEIKSLVFSKIMQAIEDNIEVTAEIVEPIKLSPKIEQLDALRIISILFDNAINAAKESSDKKISFSFFNDKHQQYIIIGNSTKEEKVDLAVLNGKFKGLSSGRHSLGLRNLRIILARNPFIHHNCQSNHHWVEQRIIIHGN